MKFIFNDGGRYSAGYKGITGDCVVRAVAIATEQPYQVVYDALSKGSKTQRRSKRSREMESARDGVYTSRKWFKDYMENLGWIWTATMHVGSGCKVHLTDGELPMGRLIVAVSKHYTAVIDGVVHDLYNPEREVHVSRPFNALDPIRKGEFSHDGITAHSIQRRCVYGYWQKNAPGEIAGRIT